MDDSDFLTRVRREVEKVLIGQTTLIDRLLIGLLCDGHVLVEGVPGLGKSLAVSTFAGALGLDFRRIQFTPDLLPADLTGTQVLHPQTGEFSVRRGPVFAQLVLADEINRAPPKVQSALLEAMQERQVTIGEESLPLPEPFLVLATQNPIEQEGTYALPEAELDRFLLQVCIDYPLPEAELEILRRHGRIRRDHQVAAVARTEDVLAAREQVDAVHVDEKILDYVRRLAAATRRPAAVGLDALVPRVRYGVSPRASLALLQSARAQAFLQGREYVVPEDVKQLARDVYHHRLVLSYEALAEGFEAATAIEQILAQVEVP